MLLILFRFTACMPCKYSTLRGSLEGFLRFPETTHNRICPSMLDMPLFSYKVSRGTDRVLNSGVTGFCFDSKLRKSIEDPFFGTMKENWRPSQKFVLLRHWKLCVKIPPYAHCKSPRQQDVWKLLREIFRTAPLAHRNTSCDVKQFRWGSCNLKPFTRLV